MSNVTLKVNGTEHTVDVDPSTRLLYVLRNDLGFGSTGDEGLGPAIVEDIRHLWRGQKAVDRRDVQARAQRRPSP